MNILDTLNWRYAVRVFNDRKIEPSLISALVEATRLTPSSYGLQPYRLIVVESDEIRASLVPHAMGQTKVKDSSHLFVFATLADLGSSFVEEHFQRTERVRELEPGSTDGYQAHVQKVIGGMSDVRKRQWAEQQAYIALGNLLTVAALLEVDACPMGGFDAQGFDQVLGLPELGLRSCVICALGYRADGDLSAHTKKVRVSSSQFALRL